MPDMYDDLVAFRPATASELLPPETPELVVHAVHAARRRRVLGLAAVGTTLVVVVGMAVWQLVPRASSPLVAATPSSSLRSAVVVTTPTPLSATVEPRPITSRRVGVGMLLLQVDGKPMMLCRMAMSSDPPQCSGPTVTGVDWSQIPWKERVLTTTFASVDVVGVLNGTALDSTMAVEQIGHPGTLLVTSDRPPDFSMPAMTCLRSSDRGGPPTLESGLESVSGYQGLWVDGQRIYVATLADPLSVEKQVRALGYQGPLCVGTLPGPSHAELAAAQEAVMSVPGVEMIAVSFKGFMHLDVGVMANTQALTEQLQTLARAKSPTGTVVVTPELLTIT